MRTFGKRLRAAREGAGYRSAQQFAHAIGMEPHSYRKYERGTAEPNFERLVQMCEQLNVDANYLLPMPGNAGGNERRSSGGRAAA